MSIPVGINLTFKQDSTDHFLLLWQPADTRPWNPDYHIMKLFFGGILTNFSQDSSQFFCGNGSISIPINEIKCCFILWYWSPSLGKHFANIGYSQDTFSSYSHFWDYLSDDPSLLVEKLAGSWGESGRFSISINGNSWFSSWNYKWIGNFGGLTCRPISYFLLWNKR